MGTTLEPHGNVKTRLRRVERRSGQVIPVVLGQTS